MHFAIIGDLLGNQVVIDQTKPYFFDAESLRIAIIINHLPNRKQ
jgi:hypothetical protein